MGLRQGWCSHQRDDILKILAEHRDGLRQQFGVKALALSAQPLAARRWRPAMSTCWSSLIVQLDCSFLFTVQHYLEDLLGVAQVDLVSCREALYDELKEGDPPRGHPCHVGDGSRASAIFLMPSTRFGSYTAGMSLEAFSSNDLVVDAVLRNFMVIGEATRHVPNHVTAAYPRVHGVSCRTCAMWWYTITQMSASKLSGKRSRVISHCCSNRSDIC